MPIWMRWPAKRASLLIMSLVCVTVLAFAASASVPTMSGGFNAIYPPRVPGPTPDEARRALIEMLERLPESRAAAPIFEVGLNRLRHGTGLRFVEHDNPQAVDWEFNCDIKTRRFSFFTEPFKPTLKSFHSDGRFAFEGGRWLARGFHWEWLTCFDRVVERSRKRGLKSHDHPNRAISFAMP